MQLKSTVRIGVIVSYLVMAVAVPEHLIAQRLDTRPNIVFIMADDLSMIDIEPYGSTQVQTPHLARLAREGVCMDNMFNVVPICAPTRQSLLTGLAPVRNGAYPNHSRIYDGIKTLPVYFDELGYRVALVGKRHYGPASAFPFEFLGGREQDNGEGQDVDLGKMDAYINSVGDDPFFVMFTSNQPHTPWNRGDRDAYDPDKIVMPPQLVDTRLTREHVANYFAEITYLDSLVGECLAMVERSGKAENTVVIFTTEQGNSFPFSKWTLYDQGMRSGFIVRWPGKVKPGTRNPALLQYTDVLPTLVDIAGGNVAEINTGSMDGHGNTGFDGHSFKGLLIHGHGHVRDFAYGVNTTRGIRNGNDAYASRSVRDTAFLYIHNLNFRDRYSNLVTSSALFEEWLQTDSVRASAYLLRSEEELYDIKNDPYQLTNLAAAPQYHGVKNHLRAALEKFMEQQGDEGVQTELRAFDRQQFRPDRDGKPKATR